MYFSEASTALISASSAHQELRRTIPGLDKKIVGALLGDSVADEYDDLFSDMRLGSALFSGDLLGAGWTFLKKETISPAIAAAVSGFVTSTWYSLKYPVVGGALQWAAGIQALGIGAKVAATFGPPTLLVNAAAFGATLAVLYPANRVFGGVRRQWDHKKEMEFLKVALPAVIATAEADGSISVEELRIIRDLTMLLPQTEGFSPRAFLEELSEDSNERRALATIASSSLGKKHRKKVLHHALLTALADEDFSGKEKAFIESLAQALKLTDELPKMAQELEEDLQIELHLAEAGMRLLHAIALADGELKQDAAELLDLTLINTVGPEKARRRIINRLRDKTAPQVFSKEELLTPVAHMEQSFFERVNPTKKSEPERLINHITNLGITFLHALETLRGEPQPQHRVYLTTYLETYGVSHAEIEKRRASYVKDLEKAEKDQENLRQDTGESLCPNCNSKGQYKMVKQNYLSRNHYECLSCKQRTVLCILPGCKHMAIAGDFYTRDICPRHRTN